MAQNGHGAISTRSVGRKCSPVLLSLVAEPQFSIGSISGCMSEEQEKRLDILVENAGMLPGFKAETRVDGWESTSVLVQISRLKTITDLDRMSQFTGQQSIHFPSCPAPSASYDRNGKNTQHNTQAGDSCKRGALLD